MERETHQALWDLPMGHFSFSSKDQCLPSCLPLPYSTILSQRMKAHVSMEDCVLFKCQKDMGEAMRVDFPVGEFICVLLGINGGIHKYPQASPTSPPSHLILKLYVIVD